MRGHAAFRTWHIGAGGFTLLEVMAAVVILGIAVIPLLYGQAQAVRAQARTQNVTLANVKAMELADWALAFRHKLPTAGDSMEVPFDPPFDFLDGTIRVEQNEFFPGISDVYIALTWDESGARRPARRGASYTGDGTRRVEICFYVVDLHP